MSSSLSKASLPVFELGLTTLQALLDKGEAYAAEKKFDSGVLAAWRLAPDMFPLTRQVQIVTDQVKNGSARLAGIEPPPFADDETTLAELKARIAKTIAFVKTLDAAAIDGAVEREIVFPRGGGKKGRMRGGDYLHHFMLPNFYFHMSATYLILRHCGVPIGKLDFLGAIPMTPE